MVLVTCTFFLSLAHFEESMIWDLFLKKEFLDLLFRVILV